MSFAVTGPRGDGEAAQNPVCEHRVLMTKSRRRQLESQFGTTAEWLRAHRYNARGSPTADCTVASQADAAAMVCNQ